MGEFKINIKATNFNLTPEIKTYINSKVSNIEKFLKIEGDTVVMADVEVEKETGEHHKQGQIFRAEINLSYQGKVYRAESTREDIATAIDEACHEVSREVKKNKERSKNLIRRGGAAIKKLLRFGKED